MNGLGLNAKPSSLVPRPDLRGIAELHRRAANLLPTYETFPRQEGFRMSVSEL